MNSKSQSAELIETLTQFVLEALESKRAENIVRLAIDGGCNAVASTLGVLGLMSRKYAHRIPFVVKINHNELLTYPNRYKQILFAQVEQAWELGAAAVTLEDNADQPLFEQTRKEQQLWQQTRVSGLFPADADTQGLWQALPQSLREHSQWRVEILEDKDWEREWMQHYQPLQYAPNQDNRHTRCT